MAEKEYLENTRSYRIEMKIGKTDLTPDLVGLTIVTAMDLPYQTFFLDLIIDPISTIEEELYGQTPINLKITLMGNEAYPLDTITMELMYLESQLPVGTMSKMASSYETERRAISFIAVSRLAYKTMNTYVNSVYHAQTIESIITDLVSQTGAKLAYSTNGKNTEVIDQSLIPPSTLFKNLGYIDRTWGIFNGISNFSCTYDNIVTVKNVTSIMSQSEKFTIYQIASDMDSDNIIEKCIDGKHFFTMNPYTTKYEGNSFIASAAPVQKHIVKPKDKLSQTLQINLPDFIKQYGINDKSTKLYYDKLNLDPSRRIAIYKDHTGYESSQSFINAKLAKQVGSITELSISVGHNIKILNLMETGEAVMLKSYSSDVTNITGKFILKASEIKFERKKEWNTKAVLKLMRSNRLMSS